MLTFKSKLILIIHFLTAGVASVHGEELLSVRFGSHQGFDRMVCELSGSAEYDVIVLAGGIVELHLRGVVVSEKFFLPKLPSQIKLLSSVEAFREGEGHVVLEVRGIEPLHAKTTELRGQSWRLAIDLSKLSEQPLQPALSAPDTVSTSKPTPKPALHDDEVPYVPGDRPIETILANDHSSHDSSNESHLLDQVQKDSVNPEDKSKVIDHASMLASDSLKALEVLAEFYDIVGDTLVAKDYAKLYLDKRRGIVRPTDDHGSRAAIPLWLMIAVAVVSGMVGGFIGGKLRLPSGGLKLPNLNFKIPLTGRSKEKGPFDAADQIEEDIQSLDRAVASEKSKTAKQPPKAEANPGAKEAPVPKPVKREKEALKGVPQDVLDEAEKSLPADDEAENVEDAMKESLMDRRVKRVLELSAESKSLAEIAQELDMGQDEVKLILDLHS